MTCQHLSHLPSGKCRGCGEQHQPLPHYQPGDDLEFLAAEHEERVQTNPQKDEIERVARALCEAAHYDFAALVEKYSFTTAEVATRPYWDRLATAAIAAMGRENEVLRTDHERMKEALAFISAGHGCPSALAADTLAALTNTPVVGEKP